LSLRRVSGKQLSVVVGGWTWQLLLRRPSLVALKHCYRFINRYMNEPHPLWPCVARELSVVMALAPLLRTDLKCQLASQMVATDSSSYAAGVVSTRSSSALERSVWPLSSSQHCSLLPAGPAALPAALGVSQPVVDYRRRFQDFSGIATTSPAVIQSCRWATIISAHWQHPCHINALELQSVLLAMKWWLSRAQSIDSRLLLAVDSSVVYYSLKKGRCSSPAMLSLLRRFSSLVLASGVTVLPVWVPSALNPADSASRKPMQDAHVVNT
jgi:hypothetical protein